MSQKRIKMSRGGIDECACLEYVDVTRNYSASKLRVKIMKTTWKLAATFGLGALMASQASANLVINGDFESGVSGFSSGYGNVTGSYHGLATGGTAGTGEGLYAVGTDASFYHSAFTSAPDHSTTGPGNMMIVNGSTLPNINVWTGQLSTPGIQAEVTYLFSAWVMNVYHDGVVGHEDANLQFSIGTDLLGTFTATGVGVWQQFTATYTPSASGIIPTAVDLRINYYANDFALDDISLVAVPEPTTMIAGMLLLLPFGASTLRMLRRRQVA
jgi:hypothetical protein